MDQPFDDEMIPLSEWREMDLDEFLLRELGDFTHVKWTAVESSEGVVWR